MGLVFSALILYFSPLKQLAGVFAAVIVHELGHLLVIMLTEKSVKELSLNGGGLCISYTGAESVLTELLCSLSGPLFGLVYAWVMSHFAAALNSETLAFSAGASLALSFFNLLPALPLDGGRATAAALTVIMGEESARRLIRAVSIVILLSTMFAGLSFAVSGRGIALLCAGIWLLYSFTGELGIVKSG